MKSLIILLFGVVIMLRSEVAVPYPNPQSSGSELMAKEMINGTFVAAIDMYIKNVKTGMERYVHVPDSKVVDTMEGGEIVKNPTAEDIDSNTTIYNRDKMLEDAVLPKKVPVGKPLAQIISKAMCPQTVTKVGEVNLGSSNYGVTHTSNGERLAIIKLESDNNTPTDSSDDTYGLYILDGITLAKKYDFGKGISPHYLSYVNGRSFFVDGNKIYEYGENGYSNISQFSGVNPTKYAVCDNGNYYILGNKGYDTPAAINVDTGEVLLGDFTSKIVGVNDDYFSQSVDKRCMNKFCVKDGSVVEAKRIDKATSKTRFDYNYDLAYPYRYNESMGVYEYPIHNIGGTSEYLGSIKETYFFEYRGNLYYSKDLIRTVKEPLDSVVGFGDILLTREYFYYVKGNIAKVFEPSNWKIIVPRPEYGQEFAKEDMLKKDYNYIGDEL